MTHKLSHSLIRVACDKLSEVCVGVGVKEPVILSVFNAGGDLSLNEAGGAAKAWTPALESRLQPLPPISLFDRK